jgi:hypothetical protein
LPWEFATHYKRALKKAYELQGFRNAVEVSALFAYQRARESEPGRKWDEKFRTIPLKEYFNQRDKPYADLKAKMDEILARGKQK